MLTTTERVYSPRTLCGRFPESYELYDSEFSAMKLLIFDSAANDILRRFCDWRDSSMLLFSFSSPSFIVFTSVSLSLTCCSSCRIWFFSASSPPPLLICSFSVEIFRFLLLNCFLKLCRFPCQLRLFIKVG